MLNFNRKKHSADGINLTPLVDVIFILLIFFMIFTQFRKNAIPIDLPQSESEITEDKNSIVLSVTNEKIEMEGEIVTIDSLTGKLLHLKNEKPDIVVTLACNQDVPFEKVVQVLEKINSAGISRMGILHDPLDY